MFLTRPSLSHGGVCIQNKKKSLGKLLWLTRWNWSSQSDWSLPVIPSNWDAINFILVLNNAVWKVKTGVAPLRSSSKTDKIWVVLPEWVASLVSIWKARPRTECEVGSGVLSVSNSSNIYIYFFSVLFTSFAPSTSVLVTAIKMHLMIVTWSFF